MAKSMTFIKTSDLGPTIETARLILRPPILDDFEAFADFHADPKTMEFLGGVQAKSTAWRTFNGFVGTWYLYGFSMFSVLDKQTGEWLGRVGALNPLGWPGPEVGWGIKSSAEGKGIAREASVASMDYAVDVLKWEKIIHTIAPKNIASQNLAKRLGSTNLGETRLPPPHETIEIEAWGQSAQDWQINRKKFL